MVIRLDSRQKVRIMGRTIRRAEKADLKAIMQVLEAAKKIIMPQLKFEIEKMKPQLEAELIDTLPTNANFEITKLTDTELQFDGGFDFFAVSAD